MRATKHFQYGLLLSTPKERKENKTIYTGKLPTSKKKNEKSFLVFILILLQAMEIKLTNFFGFSQGLTNTQEKGKKNKIKLAWIKK